MIKDTSIVCAICGRGEFSHDRVNGECLLFRSADVKPYTLRRREKTPSKGWAMR